MNILVDPEDEELFKRHTWWITSHGYVCTNIGGRQDKQTLYLHRVIMEAGPEEQVDHRNRNRLDNRRSNLRLATVHENNRNVAARTMWKGKRTNSRFKGVVRHRQSGRWNARIRAGGQQKSLGYFDDEVEAAQAYDEAARRLHGEFAWLNFPQNISL